MADPPGTNEISALERTRVPLDAGAADTLLSRSRSWLLAHTPDWPLAKPLKVFLVGAEEREELAGFVMQPQCHTNWCWAAVASSVAKYFNPASACKQCLIAKAELKMPDCCDASCNAKNVPYNLYGVLKTALEFVECNGPPQAGSVELSDVQKEIKKEKRPICVRVEWKTGNAGLYIAKGGYHFVAIVGYLPGTDRIIVKDPWFGNVSPIPYDKFLREYQGAGGTWIETYFTKKGNKICS